MAVGGSGVDAGRDVRRAGDGGDAAVAKVENIIRGLQRRREIVDGDRIDRPAPANRLASIARVRAGVEH
jgi:hypothetical protein